MRTRSPLQLSIADLTRPGSSPRDVVVEAEVDWAVELSRVLPEPPMKATLRLGPMSGGLMVQGRVRFRAEHVCHRCLTVWSEEMQLDIAQLYSTKGEGEDAEYELGGDVLDLEPLLRDEVLLAMPLLPRCPAGCTPASTAEANEDNEEPRAETSPFAVLRDLFRED